MIDGEHTDRCVRRVLFAGPFGAGKTTLINALLGTSAASMEQHSWAPYTDVTTQLRYAEKMRAIVHFPEKFSTGTNPDIPQQAYLHMQHHGFQSVPPMEIPWEDRGNYIVSSATRKHHHMPLPYEKVELFVNSALLRMGLEFVDTRGFVDHTVGNEALIRELPMADAVVFVLDSVLIEPWNGILLDEDSRLFLEQYVIPTVGNNMQFVLTHFDKVPQQDRNRLQEYVLEALMPLTRYGRDGIFFLSARDALNGKLSGSRKKVEQSGILPLEAALKALTEEPCEGEKENQEENGTNYFSWDNIRQLTDVDGHIAFASRLVSKYDWGETARRELQSRLNEIRAKQQDKRLNLSVIGEFSSGKSTFINALLRMDLLEACVLQGTTVASTILEYGNAYQISISNKDGRTERLRFSDFAQLKQKLNTIVAENDNAQQLSSVTVQLPSETLKAGQFRIIDTPGLDATVQWHAQVTIEALRQKSDLSIVLVDAVRPLPDSLCEFITEYLGQVLEQCVFVVTKIDLIPPREREMMVNYVERVAKTRLHVINPLVLPYTSLAVINTFAPGSFPESKYKEDAQASFASEAKIMEHMARQRALVQTRKLLSLVEQIYGGISEQMHTMTEDYRRRLEMLERSRQADLTEFVWNQKSIRSHSFENRVAQLPQMASQISSALSRTMQERIIQKIDQQESTDKLNNYLKENLAQDCQQMAVELCDRAIHSQTIISAMENAFCTEIASFQSAFQQQFRKLNCLAPEYSFAPMPLPEIKMPGAQSLAATMENAQKSVTKENWRIGGATAAGAAIGTTMFPVVGTALGAGVGFVVGCFFGVNLDKMKSNTKSELAGPLKRYFDQVASQTDAQVSAHIRKMQGHIQAEIDRYLRTYQERVDGWIYEEKAKHTELEHKVQMIREDMHQIEIRRENLDSVRKKMKPTTGVRG